MPRWVWKFGCARARQSVSVGADSEVVCIEGRGVSGPGAGIRRLQRGRQKLKLMSWVAGGGGGPDGDLAAEEMTV